MECGILRSAAGGRYWLDEAALVASRSATSARVPPRGLILVVGLLVLVGLAALGARVR